MPTKPSDSKQAPASLVLVDHVLNETLTPREARILAGRGTVQEQAPPQTSAKTRAKT